MATIRRADVFDLFATQETNLVNLPENYVLKYYFFHALSWPQLISVAHSTAGKLVGYVLAKLEDEDPADRHGHVTSVAVLRHNRKLGLASKLMKFTQAAMQEVYDAQYASLHVRVTNRAAYSLYKHTLSYRIHEVDPEYYADKEDAFNMRVYFHPPKRKGKSGKREEVEDGENEEQKKEDDLELKGKEKRPTDKNNEERLPCSSSATSSSPAATSSLAAASSSASAPAAASGGVVPTKKKKKKRGGGGGARAEKDEKAAAVLSPASCPRETAPKKKEEKTKEEEKKEGQS